MVSEPATWRAAARELAIMLACTIIGLGLASVAAVLIGTMPAFLSLAIWGGR